MMVKENGDRRDNLKIMFMANAPWCTTGYGIQGKHLVWRWKRLGVDVAYFAFYGLQNGMLHVDGVPIYPMGVRPWGEDVLDAHMRHFGAHLLVTLMDVWVQDFFGKHAQREGWLWAPWMPVDQEPVPQVVIERLEGAYWVLPYSRWGEEKLHEVGITNTTYIPHGVDTRTFDILFDDDRRLLRAKAGIAPDAFVIGMVAANKGYPPRKAFPEQLLAFKKFKERVPNAVLYLHTLTSTAHGGVDILAILKNLDLRVGEDVLITDQYQYVMGLSEESMAKMFGIFDILTLCSYGEGFGIPIIEAQACGVPVVVANNSAMPELCHVGRVVKKQHPLWTPLNAWAYMPDPEAIFEAYMELYEVWATQPEVWWEMREAARAWVVQHFDWDVVVDQYWRPFLSEVANELGLAPVGERDLQPAGG